MARVTWFNSAERLTWVSVTDLLNGETGWSDADYVNGQVPLYFC